MNAQAKMSVNASSLLAVVTVSPAIPIELILEIVATLDPQHDKQTLCSLCLVSSSIRTSSQERLFFSVYFSYYTVRDPNSLMILTMDEEQESSSSRFLCAITEYPHLVRYVQHFHFKLAGYNILNTLYDDAKSSWREIVNRLTSLRGFHWDDNITFGWDNYTPEIQATIQKALSSELVTTVVLRGVAEVPPSVIAHCSSHLRVLDVALVGSRTPEEDEHREGVVYLDTLAIGTRSYAMGLAPFVELFNPASSAFSLTRLTSLSIPTEYADAQDISSILSICNSSLKELKFKVPIKAVYYPRLRVETPALIAEACPIINLSRFDRLENLEISGFIGAKWLENGKFEQANSPLPWIALVLESLPGVHKSPLRWGSAIRLAFEVEDLSVPSLEALPWVDVVRLLLYQKNNFQETRVDFSFREFRDTQNKLFQHLTEKPTSVLERIRALEENVKLQKLGKDLYFDRSTERYFGRYTSY